ncbi:MAG: beta-ketoacyl synthase N-terminal-like domain-containing protein [Thermodesulfobacteriota bacterium]
MNQVMVASAVRTPLGAFGGKLASLSEQQLGAAAMGEVVRRAGIAPSLIDEVIVGIAKQTSNPSNGGRHAMLLARLPEDIPAYTVQRQSASGLQAVANGCWAIQCGDAGVVLAGGMESASRIPFEIYNARYDFTDRRREIVDALLAHETGAQPPETYGMVTKALVAENIARKYALSEGELAAFAEESFQKAISAGV